MGPKEKNCTALSAVGLCFSQSMRLVILTLALAASTQIAWALPAPTTTTLTLTSGGNAVATLARGDVITLTATVMSGTAPVTPGQVDFCDASVNYCTDIHLLGTAQLLKSGVAQLTLLPGNGTHSYRAVFRGTNAYGRSSSATLPLVVAGTNASATAFSSSGEIGDYTLTATVGGAGNTAPAGDISFLSVTTGNKTLGTATLVGNPPAWTFLRSDVLSDQTYLLVAGDFNSDGKPDLVSVIQDSGKGPWATAVLGDGKGNFTRSGSNKIGSWISGLLVADFDANGTPDIVANSSSSLEVLGGNGDGTFSLKVSLPTASRVNSFTTGDFNGDGLPDIAVVTENLVLIFRGNGDGTFSGSPAPPTALGGNAIVTGDFNGDWISDLAVADAGTVTILLGNGDETFKLSQTISPSGGIVAADFNEDGRLDLALSTGWVLLGNGDGTFSPSNQSPITLCSTQYTRATSMGYGDFNDSGHSGLAIDCTGSFVALHQIQVFSGRGDGTLGAAFDPGAAPGEVLLGIADFNGDGRSDIATRGSILWSVDQTSTATLSGFSVPAGTGPNDVFASFQGDINYLPSVSTTTRLQSQQATPTIVSTASQNPAPYGSPVTLTVTVSGPGLTPTGMIQFLDGSAMLGTATLNGSGIATFTATGFDIRVHSIVANYYGDYNYTSAASSVLVLTVTKATPAVVMNTSNSFLPLGASVTLTATITGGSTPPTGSVTFQDGTTQLAQVALNSSGAAAYTTANLAEGTHTIVAAYDGDNNYAPVISSSVQVVSSSKPFFTVTGTAVTVAAGATSGNTSTITITPQQGFVGSVALAAVVSAGPSAAQHPPTVTLGSSSVSITGSLPVSTTLIVGTAAPSKTALSHPEIRWFEGVPVVLACVLLFGIPSHRRISKLAIGLLVLALLSFGAIIACGGGASSSGGSSGGNGGGTAVPGTTAGPYTITVTATSGPITQQGSVALTVQ